MNNQTLISSTDDNIQQEAEKNTIPPHKDRKCINFTINGIFIVLIIIAFIIIGIFMAYGPNSTGIKPLKISIPWFTDGPVIIQMGTSRIFEVLYFSGQDNRTDPNFLLVTERAVNWTAGPQGIIIVDMYGRIEPIKVGSCTLRVESLLNPGVYDQKQVQVVQKRNDVDIVPKRIVNFTGSPSNPVSNLQKFVERFTKDEVKDSVEIPNSVKFASINPNIKHQQQFIQNQIIWEIKQYANGSQNTYVLRTNTSKDEEDRDKYQYFIGDRYLPDSGYKAIMIENDLTNGAWTVSPSGDVTHIIMRQMSYTQKAVYMRNQTTEFVERYGLVAEAALVKEKWVPYTTDNDGLWTSLFGAGELMRYAVTKNSNASPQQIAQARKSALKPLKAVLMIANISGRNKTINAKIRHLTNTRVGEGAFYKKNYLKREKQLEVSVYPGKPSDGIGLFGIDAGKTIDGNYYTGTQRYSFEPLKPKDWTQTEEPATSKRYLNHFISRSFYVSPLQSKPGGGTWFQRNLNGSQTVIVGAETLYDFNKSQTPVLDIGDTQIPEILMDIVKVNGIQYNKTNIVYKGDTSTDQIIGHLFIYKIAFDVLDPSDPEQKQLRDLVVFTVREYCQHLINNGHTMVDATGQATKWAKLTRQLFTSDYDIEDSPLKSIQLLLGFKLAYYFTGEKKWKDQYDLLTKQDGPFDYLSLIASLWDMWKYAFTKIDDQKQNIFRVPQDANISDKELQRHMLYQTHFSDEQEAFLGYYLAFQLQDNPSKLEKYRKGIEGYWHSISHSQNPLWYYIYQLAYPNEQKKDAFDQNLGDIAAWQLNRHMIDTRKYQAFIQGSRSDVIFEKNIAVNPNKIIQNVRNITKDIDYVDSSINYAVSKSYSPKNIYKVNVLPADQRSLHKFNGANFDKISQNHSPNTMEGSTTYTLPFWLGVYHNMLLI